MSDGAGSERERGRHGTPHEVHTQAGMLDAIDWPRRLRARVVEPGHEPHEPRLHGYAAESDLARHYSHSQIAYLALTGELPADDVARAFDVALAYLAPVGLHEAATHAASLARLGQAPPRAVLEVAMVGLAERAHAAIESLSEFLAWLGAGEGSPPESATTADASHARSVGRLRDALPPAFAVPALAHPLRRTAAVAAVLHACDLRRPEQLEAVWTLASIASTFAEAMATKPLAFREYPMDTPGFRYHEAE
jgi:hypothetical protein